jgi:hypothetical protein
MTEDSVKFTLQAGEEGRPPAGLWRGSAAVVERLPDVFEWGRVMVAKSFVMMVLATVMGPAIGLGVFVVLNGL